MNVSQYLIKCPHCQSETQLIAEESNPIIFLCRGCSRSVVVHNNTVFTVSEGFVKKLTKKYRSVACGRILASRVSEDIGEPITTDKIQALHEILEKPMDVKDIIKNMP